MDNQPPKVILRKPPPKKFMAAQDARQLRPKQRGDTASELVSVFFSRVNRGAQTTFFLGGMLTALQGLYQVYMYASERKWPPLSALDVLKGMNLAPANAKCANALDLISIGVTFLIGGLVIMLISQFFIKKSSS